MQDARAFQKVVHAHYGRHSRNLPWRHTKNPYRILVSEMMLQQTQVDRVVPKYRLFLKAFPTVRSLANAPLSDVLRLWQGLGYNRRAKFLHESAQILVRDHDGKLPKTVEDIERLPGIGHYTARAIVTFAHDQPNVFVETNIRTAFLHHFFPHNGNVLDRTLVPYISSTLDLTHPREWYWALMDYGAWLKKEYGNASRRSAHHTVQSRFQGSNRQIRGLIIKTVLAEKKITALALAKQLKKPVAVVQTIADTLATEGLIQKAGRWYLC